MGNLPGATPSERLFLSSPAAISFHQLLSLEEGLCCILIFWSFESFIHGAFTSCHPFPFSALVTFHQHMSLLSESVGVSAVSHSNAFYSDGKESRSYCVTANTWENAFVSLNAHLLGEMVAKCWDGHLSILPTRTDHSPASGGCKRGRGSCKASSNSFTSKGKDRGLDLPRSSQENSHHFRK